MTPPPSKPEADRPTDRELLELAAKAAGYEIDPVGNEGWTLDDAYLCIVNPEADESDLWNPLADDGDALRLAVVLGERYACAVFGIFNRAATPHASASVVHRYGREIYVEQDVAEDAQAATRRVIVRVAAAIGKEMK